jgi:hypothetical protein
MHDVPDPGGIAGAEDPKTLNPTWQRKMADPPSIL